MDDNFSSKAVVNNEHDYSNVLPVVNAITYLVKYCYEMNNQLIKLVDSDEIKNKEFKTEYKNYMYKKSYGQLFEVYIKDKSFSSITCKDYDQFMSAVSGGSINNISSLEIKLCLDFYRGKGNNLEEHENSFIIKFNPYDIVFSRKSNHKDSNMDNIEMQIKNILDRFPVANCIFCNKAN